MTNVICSILWLWTLDSQFSRFPGCQVLCPGHSAVSQWAKLYLQVGTSDFINCNSGPITSYNSWIPCDHPSIQHQKVNIFRFGQLTFFQLEHPFFCHWLHSAVGLGVAFGQRWLSASHLPCGLRKERPAGLALGIFWGGRSRQPLGKQNLRLVVNLTEWCVVRWGRCRFWVNHHLETIFFETWRRKRDWSGCFFLLRSFSNRLLATKSLVGRRQEWRCLRFLQSGGLIQSVTKARRDDGIQRKTWPLDQSVHGQIV